MTDIRCPANDRRLFFKVLDDGTLEVACTDCRNRARGGGDGLVVLALHRYDTDGELIDTNYVRLEPIHKR